MSPSPIPQLPPISPGPRKIPGGGRLVGGYFPSSKMRRPIAWAGDLQLDFLRVAEVDRSISAIVEQPFEIPCGRAGGRWVPDFLVSGHAAFTIISVQFSAALDQPSGIARMRREEVASAAVGSGYRVETELTIRREPRFANALELLRTSGHSVPQPRRDRLVVAVTERRRFLGDLIEAGRELESRRDVLWLCRMGMLGFDLDQSLTEYSEIWLHGAA